MNIKETRYIISALDKYTESISLEELHEIAYWFCIDSLFDSEKPKSVNKIVQEVIGESIMIAWKKNKEHQEFINNIRYHLSISYLVRNKE